MTFIGLSHLSGSKLALGCMVLCASLIFLYRKFHQYFQHFYSEGNDSSVSDCFSASLLRAAVAPLSLCSPFLLHCTSGLASSHPEKTSASPSEQICSAGTSSVCPQDAVTPEGCFTGRGVLGRPFSSLSSCRLVVACYCEKQCPALNVILSWLWFGCHDFACGVCAFSSLDRHLSPQLRHFQPLFLSIFLCINLNIYAYLIFSQEHSDRILELFILL